VGRLAVPPDLGVEQLVRVAAVAVETVLHEPDVRVPAELNYAR
jgi:hypothetical protein